MVGRGGGGREPGGRGALTGVLDCGVVVVRRSQGLKPDAACLKHVASALCKSGQDAAAVPVVMELSRCPDEEAVSLMAQAYARGGRRDKVGR